MSVPSFTWLRDYPHRRFNALTSEWVFVSPHRTARPWLGQVDPPHDRERLPQHDPKCYLCPGNERASGDRNPSYDSAYVFDNDFSAFLAEVHDRDVTRNPLLRAHLQSGTCRVLCYSPRHDLSLAQMSVADIRVVVETWARQFHELGQRWRWVQVFENKGALMGASNPHPHGQIWASDFIPSEPAKELAQQQTWLGTYHTPLLLDYAALETHQEERVIALNEHWIVVVPWWAVWPYETLLMPRRPVSQLPDLTELERDALAEILSRLLRGYDNLFETSFPYSFGWHGAPTRENPQPSGVQLHAHFYPPLLRSASVRKFMVGYEMLAEPQRDLTPEQAAERLRGHVRQ
jgi:UDPglucose--hexose-1-phosphate uridylyltransferase